MPSNYPAWMEKAEHDFLAIRNNMAAGQVPWDVVCFHAQQAVEKMLKALLVSRGCGIEKTHDLVSILAACVAVEPSLKSMEADCRRLTHYAVSARYPDDVYEPGDGGGRVADS
ncbi:MAG: HEPN domain-containing protein [Planctomycetota bacterium]